MMARKPLKPAELVVKWTEFAAEFQDLSNFDIAGRDFSLVKYFCLDIFIPLILIVAVALLAIVRFLTFLLKRSCSTLSTKQKIQ